MTGILGLIDNSLNKEIYSQIKLLANRGNLKSFYSDGIRSEIKSFYDGAPISLNGNIGIACCGFYETNYIIFPGYTVVYDGEIDVQSFKNVTNPITAIQKLINTSDKYFFGICISDGELYAFKDRMGSKPGMYGLNNKGNIVICSENIGFEKSDDIYGGEIFHVKNNIITRNSGNKKVEPNIYEYLFFAKNSSNIYGVVVGDFREELVSILVKDMGRSFEAVFSTCDKTRMYGLAIANMLSVPHMEPIISPQYRKLFVPNNEKYKFQDIHFKYNNILIVGLFIASGNTAKFFVETFKSKNITFLSLCPKYRFPDIGPKKIFRDKLIDPQKASQIIGCKVIYNTDENLKFVSGFEQISY